MPSPFLHAAVRAPAARLCLPFSAAHAKLQHARWPASCKFQPLAAPCCAQVCCPCRPAWQWAAMEQRSPGDLRRVSPLLHAKRFAKRHSWLAFCSSMHGWPARFPTKRSPAGHNPSIIRLSDAAAPMLIRCSHSCAGLETGGSEILCKFLPCQRFRHWTTQSARLQTQPHKPGLVQMQVARTASLWTMFMMVCWKPIRPSGEPGPTDGSDFYFVPPFRRHRMRRQWPRKQPQDAACCLEI